MNKPTIIILLLCVFVVIYCQRVFIDFEQKAVIMEAQNRQLEFDNYLLKCKVDNKKSLPVGKNNFK